MGANITIHESGKFKDKVARLYQPNKFLKTLPDKRKVPPGNIVFIYKAMPAGVPFPNDTDNMYWWVDIDYLPYTEEEIVTSVGAYVERPGQTPLVVQSRTHGLLHTFTVTENRTKTVVIKGMNTSSEPNIVAHPNGFDVCFAGCGNLVKLDLVSLNIVRKDKDLRMNNFRTCSISPNGLYTASLARCGEFVELTMFLLKGIFFLKLDLVNCHHVCPGFRMPRNTAVRYECGFSQDSDHIAVASSLGHLFVVKRVGLKPQCNLVPGIFPIGQSSISNERCFDFDRSTANSYLAFCDVSNILRVCDIIEFHVAMETKVETDGQVQSVKYSPRGGLLAVATSDATVNVYDPQSLELLYTLDAKAQGAADSMAPNQQGCYPTIIRLTFPTTEDYLAVSSTDGYVRVWQLRPNLLLQNLCRQAILKVVTPKNLRQLSLPESILMYLLQWPPKAYSSKNFHPMPTQWTQDNQTASPSACM